jgi:hypothetical protein
MNVIGELIAGHLRHHSGICVGEFRQHLSG